MRDALAHGDVLPDQAQVIARALDDLPDDVDGAVRALAQERPVDLAADHHANDLRVFGRKILDVIDPAAGEAAEAKKLADEEQRSP